MRFALVELHAHLHRVANEPFGVAIKNAIRQDRGRRSNILCAIAEAKRLRCQVILFPGWTLAAPKPPKWIVEASMGTAIVFECLAESERTKSKGDASPAGFQSKTYVANDGVLVAGPFQQVGATAVEIRKAEHLCRLVNAVRAERLVPLAGRTSLILICGEGNVVSGLGGTCRLEDRARLDERELQRRVVINPAHTPGGPQAIRDKRAWLSRSGVLITTANTHSGGGWRAAHRGAKAWINGVRADDALVPVVEEEGMTLYKLDVRV